MCGRRWFLFSFRPRPSQPFLHEITPITFLPFLLHFLSLWSVLRRLSSWGPLEKIIYDRSLVESVKRHWLGFLVSSPYFFYKSSTGTESSCCTHFIGRLQTTFGITSETWQRCLVVLHTKINETYYRRYRPWRGGSDWTLDPVSVVRMEPFQNNGDTSMNKFPFLFPVFVVPFLRNKRTSFPSPVLLTRLLGYDTKGKYSQSRDPVKRDWSFSIFWVVFDGRSGDPETTLPVTWKEQESNRCIEVWFRDCEFRCNCRFLMDYKDGVNCQCFTIL